nr:Werner syndrome-like exonuclease [Tanacetum cinerariifolium]
MYRNHSGLIVGLDTEWRPSFQRDVQDPVAILQLCVDNRCLVFQMIHSGQFPPLSLINFLNNPNNTFTAVGINTDVQKLVCRRGLGRGPNGQSFASEMVNIPQVAVQKFGRSMNGLSMNVLARDLLGIPAEPENVRISAWDDRFLTDEQVRYASRDAFLSSEMGKTHEIDDVYIIAEELHQLHLDEEALRETLEEQTMDEKAREEKIRQNKLMMMNTLWNLGAHVEPSPYTPNPVTIIPGPAGVVQLSNSICVEPSSSTPNPVRIIPGHAGLVQRAKLLKENVFILDSYGALMSTQEHMQKVVEDVGEDADFNSGAWVSATNNVNALSGTVTRCLGDINNFLKNKKLEQVVALVKFCSSNALGDLNVTLKDLSGTVP